VRAPEAEHFLGPFVQPRKYPMPGKARTAPSTVIQNSVRTTEYSVICLLNSHSAISPMIALVCPNAKESLVEFEHVEAEPGIAVATEGDARNTKMMIAAT